MKVRYSAAELFVYGTLHPDRAPRQIVVTARRMRLIGNGWVRGRLIDLGDYPGLLEGVDRVDGSVFTVPLDAWPALDAYEGFVEGAPEGSLFVRQMIDVTMADATVRTCWVYRYMPAEPTGPST